MSALHRPVSRPLAAVAALAVGAAGVVVLSAGPAAAASVNNCWSHDNGDPVLEGLSATPDPVDVTGGDAPLTLAVEASDTGGPGQPSGVRSVTVVLGSAARPRVSTGQVRLQPTTGDQWEATTTLPEATAAGTWKVHEVSLVDEAGNRTFVGYDDLVEMGLQATIEVESDTDVTKPRLTALALTPDTVDTTAGPARVIVEARAVDPQTGVRAVNVFARPAHHPRVGGVVARLRPDTTDANGWRGRLAVPAYVSTDRWRITTVAVVNGIGNAALPGFRQLDGAAFERGFDVTSGDDSGKPALGDFDRTPATVDVRAARGEVAMSVDATDSRSGVDEVTALLIPPGGNTTRARTLVSWLDRTAGSAQDGTWTGTVAVPRCSAVAGTYRISLLITDARTNSRRIDPHRLQALGLPSTVVVDATDHLPPEATIDGETGHEEGRIVVGFDEAVEGVSSASAVLRPFMHPEEPAVEGTWSCVNAAAITHAVRDRPGPDGVLHPGRAARGRRLRAGAQPRAHTGDHGQGGQPVRAQPLVRVRGVRRIVVDRWRRRGQPAQVTYPSSPT